MKRSNGAGSVYKLSGKRRNPWRAVRTLGLDDGKPIRVTIGYYPKKSDAELALSLYVAMPTSEDAHITLKGLYDKWVLTRAYTELKNTTQDNYKAAFKYLREFQTTKFANLRTKHFQKAIDFAEETGKSHSTMTKIKSLVSILSEYALAEDIVHKTYYKTLRVPRQKVRKEIPTFTDLEIKKLFNHSKQPIVETILILIYTGMRISELLSLKKDHVDIENMLIVGGVKTEAGRDRTIPIHPKIQSIILRRYNSCATFLIEYTKKVGNKKRKTLQHVPSPYRYEYYCDLYYAELDTLGIRRLTPHKARHTFFTRLSERCKDRKGMALVGGHTDPAFTERTYDQPDLERLRKVIECL